MRFRQEDGMILPDHEIRKLLRKGRVVIKPIDEDVQIQPAGVDLRLGNEFRIFKSTCLPYIDTKKSAENYTDSINIDDDKQFIIHPGEFVLATVKEYIKIPDDLMGSVDGRSSLGRLGIAIHTTSASINPGWEGRFVLEITNMGRAPVALYPGMRIAKLTLHKLSSPAEKPYGSDGRHKYQKQNEISRSRINEER
jgi:dCTP deaminase